MIVAARLLLSVVCPLALALAFPKTNLSLIGFFALTPLFLYWSRRPWRAAFRWGWLAGIIYFAMMLYWMTNSIGDYVGRWSVLALVILSAVEGLAFAAAAALTALMCRGSFRRSAIFGVAAAWVLLEMIRTHGTLGVPFAELGLAAAHIPWLLPLAAYAGVHGLTAFMALSNAALAAVISGTHRARKTALALVAGLAVVTIAADLDRARIPIPAPSLDVAIAQGNVSQRVKWSPQIFEQTLETYATFTRTAARQKASVVVWPETVITAFPLQDRGLLSSLETLAKTSRIWLLAGTIDRVNAHAYHNSLIALTPSGALGAVYNKHILVPFAEYLPLDAFLRRLPLFDQASQFVAGPGPHLIDVNRAKLGVLICYESAFSEYARRTANAGADALLVVTDDAWFGHTSGPYQHADMAVIDAVETGRWVVRAADTGVSEFVDPKGAIVRPLALDSAAVTAARIGPPIDTPFMRFGAWWLLAAALLGVTAGLLQPPRPRKARAWREGP